MRSLQHTGRKSSNHIHQTWKVIETIFQEALTSSQLMLTTMPWQTLRRQWLFIVVAGTTRLSPSPVDRGWAVQGNARLRTQLFAPGETALEPVRLLLKKLRRHQQHQGVYYRPQQSRLKLIDVAIQDARWKVKKINTAVSIQNVWNYGQDSVPGWMT